MFVAAFHSIANLETPEGFQVRWFRGRGWCQARRRAHAAEQALEWGAELICCLDIDQVYEPDILVRLVDRHFKGYDAVAAMVPMRGYVKSSGMKPFQRLAWRIDNKQFVPVDVEEGEIQKADFPTSAALLFRAADLQKMRTPWYFFTFDPNTWKQIHGEDGTFILRMQKEAGITAWVDTTIKVKHCHVFEIDDTFPERFSDWSESGKGEAGICSYEE